MLSESALGALAGLAPDVDAATGVGARRLLTVTSDCDAAHGVTSSTPGAARGEARRAAARVRARVGARGRAGGCLQIAHLVAQPLRNL
jgi:hypothetical protein